MPRLLRAWAALAGPAAEAYRLVLAGGDPVRGAELARLVASLQLGNRVVIPGVVDDADPPGIPRPATFAKDGGVGD